VFNTRYSAVTRCSRDYGVGNAEKGKYHLHQSYINTLWMGQTYVPHISFWFSRNFRRPSPASREHCQLVCAPDLPTRAT